VERRKRQKEKQKRKKEDQQQIERDAQRNYKGLIIFSIVLVIGVATLLLATIVFAEDSYFTVLIMIGIFTCLFGVLGLYEGLTMRRILSKCPACKAKNSVFLKVSDLQNKIYQCTQCGMNFDYSKK
jgi:putative Mn2+ efflux pump MntP